MLFSIKAVVFLEEYNNDDMVVYNLPISDGYSISIPPKKVRRLETFDFFRGFRNGTLAQSGFDIVLKGCK